MSYADYIAPPLRFRVYQRVRSMEGHAGVVNEHAADTLRYIGCYDYRVVWDGDDSCSIAKEEQLRPLNPTGIGTVVAMVAAARMVLGGWSSSRPNGLVSHWDCIPEWMSFDRAAACGVGSSYYCVSDIKNVKCPACLAIHARASSNPLCQPCPGSRPVIRRKRLPARAILMSESNPAFDVARRAKAIEDESKQLWRLIVELDLATPGALKMDVDEEFFAYMHEKFGGVEDVGALDESEGDHAD